MAALSRSPAAKPSVRLARCRSRLIRCASRARRSRSASAPTLRSQTHKAGKTGITLWVQSPVAILRLAGKGAQSLDDCAPDLQYMNLVAGRGFEPLTFRL